MNPTSYVTAATKQDQTLQAIRQQIQTGGESAGTSPYIWMALTALALSLLLLIMRWYRARQSQRTTLNDPAKLAAELRKRNALTRTDLRSFKRAAAHLEHKTGTKLQNPLVLALCPSLTKPKQ